MARRNEGRFASEPREGSKKRKKQGYVDKTRPPQSPSTSPDVILANAKAALAAASDSVDVEFVGCVMRASRVLEFKVWIDAGCGIEGEKMGEASTALRDALWEAVPGRPAISVQTPGRTRPLFSAEDFVRFAGQRAQVTLKTASHGRKRLLGELLGVEREARRTRLDAPAGGTDFEVEDIVYIVVHDEHVDAPVRAPLSAIQLGEKTALAPLNAQSGPLALGKPRRGGKTEGDVAAKAFVDAEVRLAPVVVFLKSYCPYCRRALKVLRECGLDTDDERLRLVQLENREVGAAGARTVDYSCASWACARACGRCSRAVAALVRSLLSSGRCAVAAPCAAAAFCMLLTTLLLELSRT